MKALCAIALTTSVLAAAPAAEAQNAIVAGTVTDATTLAPLTAVQLRLTRSNGQTAALASTNELGQYQFSNLAPGTYYIRTEWVPPSYVPQVYAGVPCAAADCGPTTGSPVVVSAGGTVTVDFALSTGGSFTGTVRRAIDNEPVPSLVLYVYNSSTSFVKTTQVVTGGVYTVTGLPTGSYFARIAFGGTGPIPAQHNYLPEMYGGIHCPHALPVSDCHIASSTPIAVTAGATTSGVDFLLDVPGTIHGRVIDAGTGLPLANTTLSAYVGGIEVAIAVALQDGSYEFVGLPPASYRVRTRNPPVGYVNEWSNGLCVGCAGTPATIAVGPGATVSGVDFALAAGGSITGRIDLPCVSQPAPGIGILSAPALEVYSAFGVPVQTGALTPTSVPLMGCPNFTYTVNGLSTGQYYLLVRDYPADPFNPLFASTGGLIDELYGGIDCVAADCDVRRGSPVPVTAGATTAEINFQLRGGLSFAVHEPPASQDGFPAELTLYDARGIPQAWVLRTILFSWTREFVGLPPGTYFLRRGRVLYDGTPCPDCPPTSGTPIVVEPNMPGFTVSFAPSSGVQVSGVVREAAGANPLSTIGVELYTDAGRLGGATSSDLFGRYVFFDVAPGRYFLRTRNDRGFADQTFAGVSCAGCDVRLGMPVVVSAADVAGVDFALSPGGIVSGVVTEPDGFVVGGVPVSLLTPAGVLAEKAVTSATGHFRVMLPSGSYRARAEASPTHGAETFSEQPCTSAACDVTAGVAVVVATGATTPDINFTVPSCSAMTVTPPSLATGVAGRGYRQVLSTSGGVGPVRFALTDGLLPLGVSLGSSTGILEGTPAASGQHAFTIAVVDANGCGSARAFTLDVHECAFTLSPASATVPAVGKPLTIAIGDPCGVQTVTATSFVTVQSNTPGQIVLDVPSNSGQAPRFDTITIGRRVFTVRQAGLGSQPPFGVLDTPGDGTQVSGSLPVGGWALDDLEVSRVQIFRDPVDGEAPAQIFIGTAVFVRGARPDIQQAYPAYPQNDRAGWGYLILTNMLPNLGNGLFRIYAYAEDAEGARTLLGARTIVATNASSNVPFGAIDTPAQGETVAGSAYLNWGWALTPKPKIIPVDGSTIQVLVDGVSRGNPTYNLFRSDVSGLFPGLANSGGPVGYRMIDTTALAEGQHTIAWIVTDSLGAATGIGSRYFSVANSADAQPLASGSVRLGTISTAALAPAAVEQSASSIAVVAGPDSGRRAASLSEAAVTDATVLAHRGEPPVRHLLANDGGPRTLTINALERLQLTLSESDDACAGSWAGYLVAEETLTDLPVGSAIDPAGTFYWQPGPAFVGTFELLFVRTACDGSKKRLPLTVTIDSR